MTLFGVLIVAAIVVTMIAVVIVAGRADRIAIDATEFEESHRDPRTSEFVKSADEYLAAVDRVGRNR